MGTRKPTEEEKIEVFEELWTDAAYHIISGMLDKCGDWDEDEHTTMVKMVIAQLAMRYGVLPAPDEDDDEDDALN